MTSVLNRMDLPAAALIVCGLALAAILTALAFQHMGGYVPCFLCYLQRYAYYAGIPLAIGAFALARSGQSGLAAALLALAGLGFVANAGLGVYHAGVEWKWWAGPQACGGGDMSSVGGSLLDDLRNARAVACDQAPWRLAGLSFAGWNAVISLAMAAIALAGARKGYTRT